MSGTSARPPQGDPRRQNGKGPGDEPTEPMVRPAPGWPALPPPYPGELALPPARPEELALPAATPPSYLLLPAPGGTTAASSQTGPTASSPAASGEQPPARTVNPWLESHRWTIAISIVSLVLLVVCAAPIWTFAIWSTWADNSHAPPPVLARLDPGGQGASKAVWSPDGKYLAEQITLARPAAGKAQGAIVLWDVRARREVRRFTGANGGLTAAWSPDGRLLATTNGTETLLWQASAIEQADGDAAPVARLAAPDQNAAITGLAWAKDGQTLAMADEDGLGIWQTTDGAAWQQTSYFTDGPCATMLCGRRVSWSPDGLWLLAAPWHAKDGASGVGVWAAQTWNQQPLLKAAAVLAWSPDSSLVLVRNQDETTLSALRSGQWTAAWQLDPNKSLHQRYKVFPEAAGWSPDGHWLAGSADGWVNLWPLDTRKSAWVWEEQARNEGVYTATSLAWSPDGRTLAVTTDGVARLTLYDLSNPSPPLGGPPGY